MQLRRYLILLALIVAALGGVFALNATKDPVLGLDLQGGLEVVLEAVPPKGHELTEQDLDRSVEIMRSRVDKLGVAEPEIRQQGDNQIVIELAGVHDQARAAEIIGQTARLELYDLETSLTGQSVDLQGNPVAEDSLYRLLAGQQAKAKRGSPEGYYVFKNRLLADGPFPRKADAERRARELRRGVSTQESQQTTARVKPGPGNYQVFAVPQGIAVLNCTPTELNPCPGAANIGQTYWYLFKFDPDDKENPVPQLTGSDLKLDGTRQDFDPTTGEAVVLMDFTDHGSDVFQRVTREEWLRGRLRNAPQHFAIVLDREIRSFPQIDYTDRSLANGISGNAQITNIGSTQEAKDLALVLQTGALPVDFVQVERTDVSATLGKDSLNQAWKAAVGGLIAVALFLLLVYRFLGLIAIIGLGIYAAFLYGVILLLNVTLTLPGFAGMILTIGVAADANIVIFERIKEEVRSGRSVRSAIATGYSKGFATIIDANVVTAIAALILFAVATAGVKGFALMLLIGTALSLITAVAATRAMLGILAGFRWFTNPKFMGAAPEQRAKWLQIDFMSRPRRYTWFALSATVIAIGFLSLGVRGLNLGIDFEGGTQVTFKTPQPVNVADVRAEAARVGQANAVIQGRGEGTGDRYRNFSIRTESLTPDEQSRLTSDLEEEFRATSVGVKNVSASFGEQIARAAILAVLVSLILIVAYIALRFDWRYSIPVIVAMLHDIAVTVGVYSVSGREVTTSTVAAVLTVLGYSIYDTIIIFDRIRENVPIMRRSSFTAIANVSLWETIRRSLATSFITLLPVSSLLFFGGDTLKDFAFALLIGIFSGAYSTIFIATPLLGFLKEREPEWRRRATSTEVETGVGALAAAEAAASAQPSPALIPEATPADATRGEREAKREQRRQRRRARPHGRAR